MTDSPSPLMSGATLSASRPAGVNPYSRSAARYPASGAVQVWSGRKLGDPPELADLVEREHAVSVRERQAAEKLRELNARESVLLEAEEQRVELIRKVAAEAFARGVAEARGQDASLDALDAALALPHGLKPVDVPVQACGYRLKARVIPGSPVTAAEALASLLEAIEPIDDSERSGE